MRRISEMGTFPAPVGGLNVSDSLAAMDPKYATVLKNMVTQPYGIELRPGCVRHAKIQEATGPVETVVTHQPATDDPRLYAFCDGDMYDVTDPGDMARPSILSVSNNIWNGVGVSNASGFNTILFNGEDDGIWIHDNSTITRITLAVDPFNPTVGEIAGVDPKKLIGGTVHQKRVWLIQKDTTKAWYLAPEAIFGQATVFDFGSIFTKGGRLFALATWTVDAGDGMDDMLVAISSRGQIAIYKGTDPAGSDTWGLIGVFQTGQPLDMRAMTKVEGDLVIMTQFGLLSLSEAMARSQISGASSEAYLSNKIQYLIAGLATDLRAEFGWVVGYWPDENQIVINVPIKDEAGAGQLVQSTITQGWAQFDNWDAVSWVLFGYVPVFGDRAAGVWRAWEGVTDGAIQTDATTIVQGDKIYGTVQTAFNYLGSGAVVKHAKLIRPTFVTTDAFSYSIAVNPDFSYNAPLLPGREQGAARSLWDSAVWDVDVWNTYELATFHHWTAVSGIGSAFAVRLSFQLAQKVMWASYDLMYENGEGI